MSEPTVCIKGLRPPFLAASLRTGEALPALLARFDVAPALLADLSARVPHSLVVRVWEGLGELAADPCFGPTAVSLLGPPQLDLVDFALLCSPTPRALGETFLRYQRLFHDANDARVVEGEEVVETRHAFRGELPRSRHFVEFIVAVWSAKMRALLGEESGRPRWVSFRHARPALDAPYEALLGAEVRFGAEHDALALPRATLDSRLANAAESAHAAFDRQLQAELARLAPASFAQQLRARVVALLRSGSSEAWELEALARGMRLSRRTLQRRLAEEGGSFRDVLDDARKEVALDVLARGAGTATMTDLAFALGFSEHSAFSRAFRRWTGQSPSTFARSA